MKQTETKPVDSILIEENKQALSELAINLIYGKNIITQIIREWNTLTGHILTIKELSDFFEQGRTKFLVPKYKYIEDFLFLTLVKDKKSIISTSGLQISEQKLREILVLPDTTALYEVVEKLIYIPEVNYREILYWNAYSIKGLEVTIIETAQENLKDQFKVYATTDLQKARFEQVQILSKQINSIYNEFQSDFKTPVQLEIRGLVKFDPMSQKIIPDATFVTCGLV